jgi:DNA (cytosine-5)-methyltransferase 1
MNYIDLFHGIGGFALGAYWAGMKFDNHFCSDIEPYAQKLYKLRFPDSIQLGDITKIDTEALKQYGTEWIITGGFPCQDISIAGKGAGITGARSGLWFEYWRIIRDLRPRFAIMENVGALTFRGLDAVLGSLAEIGYNAEWQDIRSSDMGAPHKRERIWIVAYPESLRSEEGKSFSNTTDRTDSVADSDCKRCEELHLAQEPDKQEFNSCPAIENTGCEHGKERMQKQRGLRGQQKERDTRNQLERPGSTRIWDETIESRITRMDDGVSRKMDGDRLRGIGNAIVPQIAELLFNQIKNYIQEI